MMTDRWEEEGLPQGRPRTSALERPEHTGLFYRFFNKGWRKSHKSRPPGLLDLERGETWGPGLSFRLGNISLILVAYPPYQKTPRCLNVTREAAASCGSDTHLLPNVLWQPLRIQLPHGAHDVPNEMGAALGDQEWP